ncbi:MAG: D-hexose-6-phosphate mutarotase [Gallionellaceae bacterium]|jgi:D-hexose-6-phosphate mutarotase|nr:D-hexose-6-phosphate mutarotase [Gallionellaceae bacterium]
MTITALNQQFAIGDKLQFIQNDNGTIFARVTTAHAQADIALQGAHVMTFTPAGAQPVIWLSPAAKLTPGKSLRGGVPICWPWFGAHATDSSFPGHGFARTVPWVVEETAELADGSIRIVFALPQSSIPPAQWPHACRAKNIVTVGRALSLELATENTGDAPFEIGEALHTYFAVGDVERIRVAGLDGAEYFDKVDDWKRKTQAGDVVIAGEVDRLYVNTESTCVIEDPVSGRRIRISKSNSRSTVVWNPGAEKAAKMGDFGSDDGHLRMVCVESGNAGENVVNVAPGESHSLFVTYESL